MSRPWNVGEFGWDTKDAGISVLLSEVNYNLQYSDLLSYIPPSVT